MVGYGPEDSHFVVELTYNYGITHYEQGNDFIGLTVQSSESLKRAAANNWPVKEQNGQKYLEAPGGYKFFIVDKPQPADRGMFIEIENYILRQDYVLTIFIIVSVGEMAYVVI